MRITIKKGINDIATTHPQYVKYFLNEEESTKYSHGSTKRLFFKCPNCQHVKEMPIQRLIFQGFGCERCSDGISFGEKFIANLLTQLNIDYFPQLSKKQFDWCGKYRYDFYLVKENTIIEVHGQQHYRKSFETCGGDTLNQVVQNDEIKKKLAEDNGIDNYIIIDVEKSEVDYIIKSIKDSMLNKMFDLSKVDFNKCGKYAIKSLVVSVCELWNEGLNVSQIMSKTKLSRPTICRYLNSGNSLNLCNYDGSKTTSIKKPIKIQAINSEGKSFIFNSLKECETVSEELFGVKMRHINRYVDSEKKYKGFYFKSIN